MVRKKLVFPCTKECLVYASCTKLCWEYKNYVNEVIQAQKYRHSIVFPQPPQSIRELAELLLRGRNKQFSIHYYPSSDVIIIGDREPVIPLAVIPYIRKRENIIGHPKFPKELICNNPYYQS